MKELSIEEKAKAYDEAIKVLHKYDGANIMFSQSLKEEMFPELKESEDEKIRKELLNHLKKASYGETLVVNTLDYKRWADWFEKQGEQKPYGQREECLDCQMNYAGECKGSCAMKRDEQNPVDKVEPKFKVGDRVIGVVSGMPYFITKICDDHYNTESGCIIMFNAQDNFELVEQKSADLKTKAGNWYVCEMEVMNENMTTAFHRDEVYYCPEDGYIDVNGALFEVGTLDVFRLATKEEIPQQKQEWSEEDEKMYARIVRSYTSYEGRILYATGLSEDNRNNILEDLNEQELWLKYRLKSLRPQKQWKPSDEQMLAISTAINVVGKGTINGKYLIELQEQLKKLREE